MASICRTMRRKIVRNANKQYNFDLNELGNGINQQRVIVLDRLRAKRQMKAK